MNSRNPGPNDGVLVTGASRGLGRETALTLAAYGFRVWAGIRDERGRENVLSEARRRGVELRTVRLDVTDRSSVADAVTAVVEESGQLYGLVNNAGITVRGYFEDLSDDEIRRIFEVNMFGTMNVTRCALPLMRAAGRGRIVMMSSIAARVGSMSLTAYTASKFALEGFSESLFLEVRPLGIQVVMIEPGIVKTDIWDQIRGVAARAQESQGPYYEWLRRVEKESEALVNSSRITTSQVAHAVRRALTAARPRLRYTVGRRARLVVALRRYLPGKLFERIYFGEVLRRVTGERKESSGA